MEQGHLFSLKPTQRCVRCGEEKPTHEFAWREKAKGRRFAHCRACQSKYFRKHYGENRRKYIDRAAARKRHVVEERWKKLLEYLREHPCMDCGESDVLVLEFDHLRDKEFLISHGIRERSWVSIQREIAKM